MDHLRAKSVDLTGAFIAEVEASCPDLLLNSPRDPERRGSQVGFRHRQGHAVMQALIAEGVIGDFRAPDVMRFGFAPLYLRYQDLWNAVIHLRQVMDKREWDSPEFRTKAAVT